MRRSRPLAAACSLFAALLVFMSPLQAATLYFSPDAAGSDSGSAETALQIDKLGSVPMPRGRFFLRGDKASLSIVPEWEFDRHIVLSGRVLDTRITKTASRSLVSGTILFTSGEWIGHYDRPDALETVRAASQTITGHIDDVGEDSLTVRTIGGTTVTVPLASVTSLSSARAFHFSIPAGALEPGMYGEPPTARAESVAFTDTGAPFQLAALKAQVKRQMDDGDIPTRKLVAIGTVLSLVELGQLVPYIVVPTASSTLSHQMLQRIRFSNAFHP